MWMPAHDLDEAIWERIDVSEEKVKRAFKVLKLGQFIKSKTQVCQGRKVRLYRIASAFKFQLEGLLDRAIQDTDSEDSDYDDECTLASLHTYDDEDKENDPFDADNAASGDIDEENDIFEKFGLIPY